MINLLKATAADAAILIQISREIYQEHYLHLWHPGGAAWYMDSYAYAKNTIEKELEDPLVEYYLAMVGEDIIGYLKLTIKAILLTAPLKDAMELERIYLYKSATGRGFGKEIMEFAKQRAVVLNKEIIFLKAMDSSEKAIAFYKENGYQVCGSLKLPLPTFKLMKEEFRGMLLLQLSLK